MKNLVLLLLLTMAVSTYAQADRAARIKSLKIAFLTERLDLSEKEAQQFWPIYNANEEKMELIRTQERRLLKNGRQQFASLTEEEAQRILSKMISIEQQQVAAKKELIENLKTTLPSKKIIILWRAEEDFKRNLFKQLRERYKDRRDGRNRP